MDDLTMETKFVQVCKWILKGLEEPTTWAHKSLEPVKSRSLVLKKSINKSHFTLAAGEGI